MSTHAARLGVQADGLGSLDAGGAKKQDRLLSSGVTCPYLEFPIENRPSVIGRGRGGHLRHRRSGAHRAAPCGMAQVAEPDFFLN